MANGELLKNLQSSAPTKDGCHGNNGSCIVSKICPGPAPAGGRREHLVGHAPSAGAHVPPRGFPYPWQFVLWVKRGEIRSVMTGWEGLVELHLLFPLCWCHQIQQNCPTFRIPKGVGSRIGTESGIPSQVTGRSLLSQLYPASSLCLGIFQVCFPLAYKDRQGLSGEKNIFGF